MPGTQGEPFDGQTFDVLLSGASGLVGKALNAKLVAEGHRVRRLVRRTPQGPDEFLWKSASGEIDPGAVEGADAVIHLAGESIAAGRWNKARKARILDSRVQGTRHVVEAIRAAKRKPSTFLCASAVGIYGPDSQAPCDEDSPVGTDFLARVCADWEQEARGLTDARVVCLRFGMILSASGGALGKMLLPFKLGLGGPLGKGTQWMSWVDLEDVVRAVQHALTTESCQGALNVVAPHPVTNAEFTKTLGRVLSRPTVLPMPAPAVRLLFGEMGEALLLAGQSVVPAKLQATGFEFAHPELEAALRHQLGRNAAQ